MCGIAGFVDKKGRLTFEEKRKVLRSMREAFRHRGLDDKGEYFEKNLSLGHRRLSILDLSPRGRQPMQSSDEKLVIVYNGELYNFSLLRNKLKKHFRFRTRTDTETILNSYAARGKNSLKRFKGMWAFAIFDRSKQELFLSVDRFGIKPLYFLDDENWFAFASEAKALLKLPKIKPELNRDALGEYFLYRALAGEKTLLKNIKKLQPASWLKFNLKTNQVSTGPYWELKKKNIPKNYEKTLIELLAKSVREHLVSDVPVGIQLSGGVDSGLVAALAVRQKKKHFHSFSIGLKEKEWNEFDYSKVVAKKLKTIHHQITFTEKEFVGLLPELTYHLDEPINHPNSVPMYLLAKHARRYVKVLLSGEGADEVFGGYRRYETILERKNLSAKKLTDLALFGDEAIMKRLARVSFANARQNRLSLLKEAKKISRATFDRISYLDLQTYLPPLLMRQDKMGMAATLENRVPYLDHRLVEFGFSLPKSSKIDKNADVYRRTKPLLKKVAGKFLPAETVFRRKIGFGLPISAWLKNPEGLGRYLNFFKPKAKPKRPYLNYQAIQKIIQEHLAGQADHGEVLWIIVNLELWTRIFIDGVPPQQIWPSLPPLQ